MIVICWAQLPIYAARNIGMFVKKSDEDVVVLRTVTNRFPIKGAAEMTRTKVIDVQSDDSRSIESIVGCVPDVIVSGGWGDKSFWRWVKEVKRAGGYSIVCTDEPFRGTGRSEMLRKIRFKLLLNRHIDRLFVAGQGGIRKFVDYYHLQPRRVVTGLYAGDPELFFDGVELAQRPKRFIYVGHYDDNKNVLAMCRAFVRVQKDGWSLDVYGDGPLRANLEKMASDNIHIHGYVNADQLGPIYRDARCFVLGSHREQWGVVVHEACMSGCMLLLSDHVGSRFDFAKSENSVLFNPDSEDDFARGFSAIMDKTDEELRVAQKKSLELGRMFSPEVFAHNLMQIIKELRR